MCVSVSMSVCEHLCVCERAKERERDVFLKPLTVMVLVFVLLRFALEGTFFHTNPTPTP